MGAENGIMGAWYPLEQDIAINEITHFNNRELMLKFLCIDLDERQAPDFLAFKELINKRWPELLNVPINKEIRIINVCNKIYSKVLKVLS